MGARMKRLNISGSQIKSILVDFVNVVAEMLGIDDYTYKNVRLISILIRNLDFYPSCISLEVKFINGPFCTYNVGVPESRCANDPLTDTPIFYNLAYGSDRITVSFIINRDSGVIKYVLWNNRLKFIVSKDAKSDKYNATVIRIDPLTNDKSSLDYLNDNFTYCTPLNKPLIDYINYVLSLTACTIDPEKTGISVQTVEFSVDRPAILKPTILQTREYDAIISGLKYADVNDLRTILISEKPIFCRAGILVEDTAPGASNGYMGYTLSNAT